MDLRAILQKVETDGYLWAVSHPHATAGQLEEACYQKYSDWEADVFLYAFEKGWARAKRLSKRLFPD
ncbi:MAG: hypothetical protein AB7T01_08855 [Acidithiobacillus sp.]